MVAKALATICTRGQLKAKCRDWLVLEEIVSEDLQYKIQTWIYVDWKYEVVIISSNYFFYYGLCVKTVNSCTFILTLGTRKTKNKSNLNDAKNTYKGVPSNV